MSLVKLAFENVFNNEINQKNFIELVKPNSTNAIIKTRVTTLESVINENTGSV